VVDERFFKTLDTNKKMPKIIVASCMSDFYRNACVKMWDALHNQNPDVTFLIGDTVYADHSDGKPLSVWGRYVDVRNRIGIFRHKNLTPILASWDDHDFGKNNADGSYHQKAFMRNLFATFWMYPEERNYNLGGGVYQDIKLFGHKFYLMDCRYFRSSTTHFGADQEDKLFADLQNDNTPTWLMNGSQFFGGYLKQDSYEYHQNASFRQFGQKLKTVNAPVVFVSGDIHYSELMHIEPQILGYRTFEITSSSIHSFTFLQQHNFRRNPRRLEKCATSKHNFKVIEIDNRTSEFKFKVTCMGDEKKYYYQKSLEVVR
jgi:alkaline phosphatase D